MANPDVTAFKDDAAVTFRALEVTDADWDAGMNVAGSNAPGIGINQGGGAVVGTPEQFTLLDQFGNARAAQKSQCLGGPGFVDRATVPYDQSGGQEGTLPDNVIRFGPQDAAYPDGSGAITFSGNSTLTDLAVGWTIQAP
jgi:hypothetical protein